MHLIPHSPQNKGDTAGSSAQQVLVGGALLLVLFGTETGSLDEVHNRNGHGLEFLASLAGDLQILAPMMRVSLEIGPGIAFHEGKIQGPPGLAQYRKPDELFFEKEFQKRDPAVEDVLQHQNVHPGLVVGHHHIPGVTLQ